MGKSGKYNSDEVIVRKVCNVNKISYFILKRNDVFQKPLGFTIILW